MSAPEIEGEIRVQLDLDGAGAEPLATTRVVNPLIASPRYALRLS